MVADVESDEQGYCVVIDLPTPAYPDTDRLREAVVKAAQDAGLPADRVRVRFVSNVRGRNSGGRIGLRVRNVIAVGSGKGGVGKSTVAAAVAFGLKHFGAKVGLMDADVYGPSIPHLIGAGGRPQIVERRTEDGRVLQRLVPIEHDGLKVISIGFMINEDQPVIWRGPMLHKLLTQFLQDTEWGELDYLIIDLPPGTGDVSLTLSQLLGLAGAVVVCTPQKVALLDAVKALKMFHQVKIPVLGVVENMTGDVFGRGGAKRLAEKEGVPFLGEIPCEPVIRELADEGRIADLIATDNPARDAVLQVARGVAMQIAREYVAQPQMPVLEIL
ncbi:MAG: ATP-binding protein [Planctomycetota bacterium]|nr:MAG: ATP-binding protein [Planctomycetota bacterium]